MRQYLILIETALGRREQWSGGIVERNSREEQSAHRVADTERKHREF